MKTIPLKLDEMEQDLVLACKSWYGKTGIEKVISTYCGYDIEHVNLDAKYHFISELYLKLCKEGHLRFKNLLYELSPEHIFDWKHTERVINNHNYSLYDFPRLLCDKMVSEICSIKVREGNNVLVELHDADPRFKEKEEEVIVNV